MSSDNKTYFNPEFSCFFTAMDSGSYELHYEISGKDLRMTLVSNMIDICKIEVGQQFKNLDEKLTRINKSMDSVTANFNFLYQHFDGDLNEDIGEVGNYSDEF